MSHLPIPYEELPQDPQARWLEIAHQFGSDLMTYVRDQAYDQIPVTASPETQAVARAAVAATLQALAAFLDGVTGRSSDSDVQTHYGVFARFKSLNTGATLETIELAPEGDGLSMAVGSWLENDFDTNGRLERAGLPHTQGHTASHEPSRSTQVPSSPRVFAFDQEGWGVCPFCNVALAINNPRSISAFHSTCRGPLILSGPPSEAR